MTTVVLLIVVPRPGNPQENVAFAFVDEMFPDIWMLDMLTLPPIELTERLLTPADAVTRLESVRVDVVKEGRVGLFWMTGTHWPKLWMVETLLLMLRGSETDRTQ
jgi:hypothetical protein